MTPEELSRTLVCALTSLNERGEVALRDGVPSSVTVQRPRNQAHGDYATNIALQLSKQASLPPRELALALAAELGHADGIAKAEVAGPGFLNITVSAAAQGEVARAIVEAAATYGTSDRLAGKKINLEFVSANPTGPVHLGSGRWAPVGDSLARVFVALAPTSPVSTTLTTTEHRSTASQVHF